MPHGHPSSECEPSTSRNEDTDVDDRVTLSVRENQGIDHQLVLATAWFVLCDPSANDDERRAVSLRAVERAVDEMKGRERLRQMLDRTVTLFDSGYQTTKDVPRWWESDAGRPVALHCSGESADEVARLRDLLRERRSMIGASSSNGVEVRDAPANDHRRWTHVQKGLFATRDFKPWEVVGAYDGVLVSTEEFDELCEYSFGGRLEHARYSITTRAMDAETNTNLIVCACDDARSEVTRYINDPSRIEDSRPVDGGEISNCLIIEGRVEGDDGRPSLCVVTTKHVKAGEEFGMSYGEQYWAYQGRMENAHGELARFSSIGVAHE